ncbi:MAG: DUF1559 domain-containing protein [Gemmataceae bacterium]
MKCSNNLKQIGIAFHNYSDAVGYLPYNGWRDNSVNNAVANPTVKDSGCWAWQIMPYGEQDNLYRSWTFVNVPNSGNTYQVGRTEHLLPVQLFICPSRDRGKGYKTLGAAPGPVTDYAINVRINNLNPMNAFGTNNTNTNVRNNKKGLLGITDGTSNTIMVGEKALAIPGHDNDSGQDWAECITRGWGGGTGRAGNHIETDDVAGQNSFYLVQDNLLNDPVHNGHFGGPHSGVTLFVFADGSVRSLRNSISSSALCWTTGANDGQIVSLD